MQRRRPKPPGAWSLVFADGKLAGEEGLWSPDCPPDWASGGERYVLVERDDANRVATLALAVEGTMRPDGSVQMPLVIDHSTQPEYFLGLASAEEADTVPARLEDGDG